MEHGRGIFQGFMLFNVLVCFSSLFSVFFCFISLPPSFDVRDKESREQPRHWSAPEVFGSRAKFHFDSQPATLEIKVRFTRGNRESVPINLAQCAAGRMGCCLIMK